MTEQEQKLIYKVSYLSNLQERIEGAKHNDQHKAVELLEEELERWLGWMNLENDEPEVLIEKLLDNE